MRPPADGPSPRGAHRRARRERPSSRAPAPRRDPRPGAQQAQPEEQVPEQREGRHRLRFRIWLGCRGFNPLIG